MGSEEGMRFHMRATHELTNDIIDGMVTMQAEMFDVTNTFEAVARIHHALHEAAKVVARVNSADGMCDKCSARVAVVILSKERLCIPCALVTPVNGNWSVRSKGF